MGRGGWLGCPRGEGQGARRGGHHRWLGDDWVIAVTVRDYRIRLDGVRFRSRHGASMSERRLPQDFVATVELAFAPAALPASDDRREVVDYDRIASAIVEAGTSRSCRL